MRDLIIVLVLISLSFGGITVVLENKTSKKLSQEFIIEAVEKTREKFKNTIEPSHSILSIIGKWKKEGDIDLTDTVALNSKFMPILTEMTSIASLILADKNGHEYMLMPDQHSWLTRVWVKSDLYRWQRWESPTKFLQTWQETRDGSRQSPWRNKQSFDRNSSEISWEQPYHFLNNPAFGLTATQYFDEKNNDESEMMARVDLRLNKILGKMAELDNEKDIGVFLVSPQRQIWSGGHKDIPNELSIRATAQWRDNQKKGTKGPFTLKFEGETWWCGFLSLAPQTGAGWIGILMHEKDLLPGAADNSRSVLTATAAVLSLALFLSFILVRRYKKHSYLTILDLINQDDLGHRLEALIEKGENASTEFKSTVRINLNTLKTDKNIEMSWLKTVAAFLNTNGGVLIVGVSDSGCILGLEKDGFQNEDKCRLHIKNLIHQHIGPEYSSFIQFDLVKIRGKNLAVIECEPAGRPTFLRNGKNEEFFIRVGPASVGLSISQALEYIQKK